MVVYWVIVAVFFVAFVYHFGTIALHVWRHKKACLIQEDYLDLLIEALVNGSL